jgi:hypothetical protein
MVLLLGRADWPIINELAIKDCEYCIDIILDNDSNLLARAHMVAINQKRKEKKVKAGSCPLG